jgi:dihydrofolate synthase/folylpolyglutamate synthase
MVKNQMSDLGQKLQLTLDYLYSFVDYSLTRQLRYSPEKFNLDRMRELLRLMGEPHKNYPVVHIAGTKGKGSTAAMIASILVAAGYKTGLYTSPHLQDFTERIQVDGTPITHARLVDLVEKLKPLIAQVPEITTFEITTALAFQEFHDSQVDVAVIEVGLGGRLDATNVVDSLVSVITSLSFDHMNVLGDSIAQIAAEKGGIIKAGKPVVLSPQWKEAKEVIERIAIERKAPLTMIGRDYFYGEHSRSLDGQTFFLWSNQEQELVNEYISSGGRTEWEPEHFTIPLLGMHQVENAATAYATIQVMRQNGFRIERDAIAAGFRAANWPGRFEILKRNPLIIIDSAHNQDSALRLRLAMDDYLNGKPIILLFGSSEDKDVRGMFNHLLPRVRSLVATRSTHPRAMEPELLVELANQFGKHAVETQSVEEGLAEAIRLAGRDSVIMVTGSIFVAAAVRDLLVDLTKNHT